MWRHGLPQFLDPSWPAPENIFLKVEKGSFIWLKTKEEENLPANCIKCHNSICGVNVCHCLGCLPMKAFNIQPNFSLNWTVLLDSLPVLTSNHLETLLKRRNVKMAIRSVARFLSISLSENTLEVLGIPRKWYAGHLQACKTVTDFQNIDPSEISVTLQKLAYLTLVKSSNLNFPPSNCYSSTRVGGIQMANMRYSNQGLQQVFKTNFIPIVSSSHKLFTFRLFQAAHIIKNPGKPNLASAHLSVSLTTQRLKTGVSATLFSHMRATISKWVQICPFCIRVGSSERSFTHSAGDPHILSLLDVETPVFHCVSLDIFQEVYVLAHSRARGKPSYCVNIMIAADLVSKTVCFTVLDGSKMTDIIQGLQQIALRYRLPAMVLVDSGPQLRCLPDHEELTNALSPQGIKVVVVPQGHAFSNFSERMIKDSKKVLATLREDSNKTLYRQPQTLLELLGKLQLVESVMSLRPILGHTKDQTETVLTPRRITHPFLSGEDMNKSVIDIMRGVFNPDPIISQLGRTGSQAKEWLRESLISYLQDNGVRYQSEKSGNKQKKSYSSLKPNVNDVILFLDSDHKKRFGVILEILEKNQVLIRSILAGSVIERKFHVRVLTLLFRPSEWRDDIPIQ